MTILTCGACGFIVSASGAIVPAAVGTAAGVLITGVKLWVQSEPISAALATAVGTGTSAGAIAGAAFTKTTSSAVSGAVIGGLSAGSVGSVLAGSLAAGGVLSANPLSLITVGTSVTENSNMARFDCWKPVVHEMSETPSTGLTLEELMVHPNVSAVDVTPGACLPKVVIENIWKEKFELEYVLLKDLNRLYGHAVRVNK